VLYRIVVNSWRLFKRTASPTSKASALACVLTTIALSIDSLNGSFLLVIPYIAFLAFFAAGNELVLTQMERARVLRTASLSRYQLMVGRGSRVILTSPPSGWSPQGG
jgi:hypothetical protein